MIAPIAPEESAARAVLTIAGGGRRRIRRRRRLRITAVKAGPVGVVVLVVPHGARFVDRVRWRIDEVDEIARLESKGWRVALERRQAMCEAVSCEVLVGDARCPLPAVAGEADRVMAQCRGARPRWARSSCARCLGARCQYLAKQQRQSRMERQADSRGACRTETDVARSRRTYFVPRVRVPLLLVVVSSGSGIIQQTGRGAKMMTILGARATRLTPDRCPPATHPSRELDRCSPK